MSLNKGDTSSCVNKDEELPEGVFEVEKIMNKKTSKGGKQLNIISDIKVMTNEVYNKIFIFENYYYKTFEKIFLKY